MILKRRNTQSEPEAVAEPRPKKRYATSLLFILGMSLLGFLAQFQWIGHILLVIYVIFALITKRSASEFFTLALITLGVAPLAIVLGNWLVAQNFTAYSFMFFVFGMLIMTLELNRGLKATK